MDLGKHRNRPVNWDDASHCLAGCLSGYGVSVAVLVTARRDCACTVYVLPSERAPTMRS
jgi:hypothetical protein